MIKVIKLPSIVPRLQPQIKGIKDIIKEMIARAYKNLYSVRLINFRSRKWIANKREKVPVNDIAMGMTY